jgi:membrane dipeptidase
MRYCLCILCFLMSIPGNSQASRKLHNRAVLVDTHNDVLTETMLKGVDISKRITAGQSDLERWKEGGVDVQFFSVWTDEKPRNKEGFFKDAEEEIDSLDILILRNPTKILLAQNYHDVKRGLRQEKLVALIGVEGGHMIEESLEKLNELRFQGMRYLTLTWNNSTSWATSARDETAISDSITKGMISREAARKKGLTVFGKEVVRRLNELGVMVDLSHTGEQTFFDAIAATTKPVILSHSSVWNICPVFRNVKDDQIRAVAKNNGVICINFYSGFISKAFAERSAYLFGPGKKPSQDSILKLYPDSAKMNAEWQIYYETEMKKVRPSISDLVDHIDYITKLVGDDYVGIGSDFDGVDSTPLGLDDVTSYPKITEELVRRGYSNRSIKKILGKNVLRVMKANFR